MSVVVMAPGGYSHVGEMRVGIDRDARVQAPQVAEAVGPRRTVGMKKRAWMRVLLVLAVAAGIGACREYPTRPVNRRPTIASVVVFPEVIGQGDSAIVTVVATDPDGDTLVYDWFTDSRLIIKDDHLGEHFLYNTPSSSHVFYRSTVPFNDDTAWVGCSARDGRGGSDSRVVLILLQD
jgi:hypothetical protein